ncbi:MAG TPA: hypothetical protein VNN74_05995 [Candidatus Micrarchaeia archaeon]|nr:hypothetical protein [Candidatus Micrarchaeia archaeon]
MRWRPHRPKPPELSRCRAEVRRILEILDDATATGNEHRLSEGFGGDALREVGSRLRTYRTAGISVSPFRESLQIHVDEEGLEGGARVSLRYRDRTSFLASGGRPATADQAVQLTLWLDMRRDPWVVRALREEVPGPAA